MIFAYMLGCTRIYLPCIIIFKNINLRYHGHKICVRNFFLLLQKSTISFEVARFSAVVACTLLFLLIVFILFGIKLSHLVILRVIRMLILLPFLYNINFKGHSSLVLKTIKLEFLFNAKTLA